MELIYTTPNGDWAIAKWDDLFGTDTAYSIYKKYPEPANWTPFTLVGGSLEGCFRWLRYNKRISGDECRYQISLLHSVEQ